MAFLWASPFCIKLGNVANAFEKVYKATISIQIASSHSEFDPDCYPQNGCFGHFCGFLPIFLQLTVKAFGVRDYGSNGHILSVV